jgi:6-phosphogluconolactonase/glucosamine-6-phosphate isomerase/deaminase
MNLRHVSFLGLGPQGHNASFVWHASVAHELEGVTWANDLPAPPSDDATA